MPKYKVCEEEVNHVWYDVEAGSVEEAMEKIRNMDLSDDEFNGRFKNDIVESGDIDVYDENKRLLKSYPKTDIDDMK